MPTLTWRLAVATLIVATSSWFVPPLSAQETSLQEAEEPLGVGVGFRIGGYGFREIANDDATNWTDCRMDGVGVFATWQHGDYFFSEFGLDYYQAVGRVVSEEGMDRISVHMIGAFGLRAFPAFFISPFIQVGLGAEYTDVSWSGFDREEGGLFPMGFLGTGAEVSVGDHARFGANLRVYMMAAFAPLEGHVHGTDVHLHAPVEAEGEAAGQVQLWFRYDI